MSAKITAAWERKWPLFVLIVLCVFLGCASKQPAKLATARPESGSQDKMIHSIDVSEGTGTARVTMHANQPLTYTAVKHRFPLSVVLYFPDTALKGIQDTYRPKSTLIEAVHASELKRKRPSSRIEIRLNRDAPYEVSRVANQVFVDFSRPVGVPESAEEPERGVEIAREMKPQTFKEAKTPQPVETPAAHEEEPKEAAWVNRVDFQAMEAGKSRVTVGTTRKVRYETQRTSERRLLLKLFNTRIPEFQKRPLITTRFESAIDRILPIQTPKMGNTTVIAIELREAVPYRVYQKENACVVDFQASSVPPRPMPEAERPEWMQAMKETQAAVLREVEGVPERPVVTAEGKRYTGEKISLDFQDADIHNIFRILHEVSGKNFVIGEDVKGRVTLKLVNVPWDQVLDLVLRMNQLGTSVDGNIVRIAKLSTLEAEKKALASKVQADQAAKALEPLYTEFVELNYAEAASVVQHLNEVKSNRGKVTIDEGTNMIIIQDEKEAIENAKVLIDRLDKANQELATRQVMIEARIVEADSNFTRDIGIQWGGAYSGTGDEGGALLSMDLFGSGASTANVSPNFAVNLPPGSYTSGLGFTFGRFGSTTLDLDIRLLAMESAGSGKLISTPKVLTLDNKEATIKQVTLIPYQVTEEGTTSIKTEEAGITLSVTPHITRDERIRMEIHAEKGAPDWSNTVLGNPAIDTNTADTELFVGDGRTIVIGGILSTTDTVTEAHVPGLWKIPILGWLFRQKQTVKDQSELLIFVTPKIVRFEEAT